MNGAGGSLAQYNERRRRLAQLARELGVPYPDPRNVNATREFQEALARHRTQILTAWRSPHPQRPAHG